MLSLARAAVGRVGARPLSLGARLGQSTEPVTQEEQEEYRPATAQMAAMTDVGSRSVFNAEQDMFRESVRRFMKEKLEPLQVRGGVEVLSLTVLLFRCPSRRPASLTRRSG